MHYFENTCHDPACLVSPLRYIVQKFRQRYAVVPIAVSAYLCTIRAKAWPLLLRCRRGANDCFLDGCKNFLGPCVYNVDGVKRFIRDTICLLVTAGRYDTDSNFVARIWY